MHLLIGLGNIGSEYNKTRHNYGFLALDQIIADHNFTKSGKSSLGEIFSGEINNKKIIAIKPQTYMNNSGVAALETMQFYKIPLQNILVFHDEIDIALGKIRIKIGGGSAGHNGLKSLDEKIGKDYWRIRLGVGRPQNTEYELADYVLGKFGINELEIVAKINKKLSASIADLILDKSTDNITKIVNKIAE